MFVGENAELEKHGDLDLATRAVPGVVTYFACITVLYYSSPFPRDLPRFFGLLAGVTYLASVLRGILIWQRERIYTWNRRLWQAMFFLAIQSAAIAWGLPMRASIAHYGFQSWTTLVFMILASRLRFQAEFFL